MALTTRRSREGLLALAAARRSAKAGQMEATQSTCVSSARDRAAGGKKAAGAAGGSGAESGKQTSVFTGDMRAASAADGGDPGETASAPSGRGELGGEAGGGGEARPLSRGGGAEDGTDGARAGVGSSGIPTAAGPRSQKVTSVVPATLAERRVGWKARHSAWVAVVMSSPAQAPGTRVPAAVHPGHRPWWE